MCVSILPEGVSKFASGTMPIAGIAAATTAAAGMLLSAPSSSVRMRATFSTKDIATRRVPKKEPASQPLS